MFGKDYAIAAIFLAVTAAAVSVYFISVNGYRVYQRVFVGRVDAQLRLNFLSLPPFTLFVISLAGTVALTMFGAWLLGMVGAVAGAIVGLVAPHGLLAVYRRRRVARFVYQFPDALASLASSLRAGASMMKGMENLSARQPAPLSEEFALVLADYRVGKSLEEALHGLLQRVPQKEIELFIAAVLVSRSVGGSLAETLESLAFTLRQKAQVEGKIRALTGMARLQGWVLMCLPLLLGGWLALQKPAQMQPLFDTWVGLSVLAVILVMMGLAAFMIRRIVNIDV